MNSPSLQTQHHPLADLPEPDLPESPTTPPPAPTTSRPKFLSWWKTPVPPSPRTPTPLRIWIPRKSSENPKPTSCSPESRAKALLDIIARPVNGQGRVSRTIRLHCSAWTRPLWETPGIADSTLMDATLQEKNIWAWQLCDVMQNHLSRGANAVALGPLSWVDAWSDEYVHLLDTLSESEVERFSRWFSEEFYPNHNFWRARIGWPAPTSLFAQPSVAIDWRGKTPSQTPREPQPWYTVTLSHPPGGVLEDSPDRLYDDLLEAADRRDARVAARGDRPEPADPDVLGPEKVGMGMEYLRHLKYGLFGDRPPSVRAAAVTVFPNPLPNHSFYIPITS